MNLASASRLELEQIVACRTDVLQKIATGAALNDTLDALLRHIEAFAPGMLCSILLLDAEGQLVRHAAAPSLPEDYTRAVDGKPIGPKAGSCGTAAYRREQVIVEDIATDPLWADYRDLALAHGLRSCWSTPILDEKQVVLGTFAIYYREPGRPAPLHEQCISLATDLASIAIRREQAERALRECHTRHQRLVESNIVGVIVADLDGRILEANDCFLNMVGRTRAELEEGSLRWDAITPQDWRSVDEEFRTAVRRAGAAGPVEEECLHKDGHRVPVLVSMSSLGGGTGRCIGLVQDLTGQKRAEAGLRETISTLQRFIDTVPSFVAFVDADERYRLVNRLYEEWFQMPREKILGRKLQEVHRPGTYATMVPYLREVRGGRPVRYDSEVIGRDGKKHCFDVRYVPRYSATGDWLGHFVLALDVTDRKRAENIKDAVLLLESRLSEASSPEAAAKAIFETADLLWDWDAGALDVYSPAEDQVWAVMYLDTIEGVRQEVPPSGTFNAPTPRIRRIMREGGEIVLRDPPYQPLPDAVIFGDTTRLSASILCVPIRAHGQAVGVLSIQSYTPNAFTETDLKILQGLADHCGGTLERIRMTEALRHSEERYRRLFDASPIGILRADERGTILDVNGAHCRILGYTREELVGRHVSLFYRPELAHQPGQHIREVLAGGIHRREIENVTRAGERRAIELTETCVQFPDGRREILAACMDLTERRQAEEQLRQNQFLLRRVLDTNPAVIFVKDRDSRILMANRAMADFYGLRVEDVVGRLQTELHSQFGGNPGDMAQWLADDRRVIDSGQPLEKEESGTDRTGRLHRYHTLKYPIEIEPGRAAVLVITEDISARKQAEMGLQSANVQLRRFAQRIQTVREDERTRIAREIHDVLAQELTRLKLDLAWISRRVGRAAGESTRAELAGKVASMIELTDGTIESVQKLATDLRPVVLDSLGLGPAIEWQAEEFQQRTGIACTARVARDLPSLDRQQATALFRIVQESLTNVVRHARARHVEVALDVIKENLRLTVRDDGRGITPEELADTRSIGLLGMKERAALLGGETEIGPAPGGGTLVRVTTPLSGETTGDRQP